MPLKLISPTTMPRKTIGVPQPRAYKAIMAYSFTGFFIKVPSVNQTGIFDGQVFREISEPFSRWGILTPGMKASFSDCTKYLSKLEVSSHDWIFLEYHTWGGLVDYVIAIGSRDGENFGPIEGDGAPAEDVFLEALDAFGLEDSAGVNFAPFDRGFWGDK